MAVNNVDHDGQLCVSRANASPFFMGSRAPTAPWELNDMDFLIPEPVVSSTRPYFQDSPRKYCSSLHESELGYSAELKDTAQPQKPSEDWQDIPLSEYSTNGFSSYLADDVFSDKLTAVAKSQSSTPTLGKVVPSTNAELRVHTTTCTHEDLPKTLRTREETSLLPKCETSVVSPTTVNKKVLVTDNDLRLFSVGSMRELNGRKGKSSTHYSKKVKMMSSVATSAASPSFPHRQRIKRCASLDDDINDHFVQALKRTKSLDQASWSAPAIESRWYWGRTEGFHGIQPRLLSPVHSSTSLGYNGANIYRPVQHQIGVLLPLSQQFQPQYQAPKRKIGIYSPAERHERLKRFHEKRKLRVYHKRIKYDCRKRLANSCPRIKGRFVRKSEFLQAKESDSISSPTTSE
ncbi:hypothetical protein PI124_g2631 [Phytophthora idaei]|nr:hypothetical protein PI125_g2575 [Phytophthora idaei]KAG3170274.1 hypothetical protein PI126_g2459 [Phytophthora idaei]KAG3252800.1 hypothetical protein PI124_g2631 [Phytophthora idaei]